MPESKDAEFSFHIRLGFCHHVLLRAFITANSREERVSLMAFISLVISISFLMVFFGLPEFRSKLIDTALVGCESFIGWNLNQPNGNAIIKYWFIQDWSSWGASTGSHAVNEFQKLQPISGSRPIGEDKLK